MGQRIPKTIHQIWLGGELPERFAKFSHRLRELHPDWEYKLWGEQDLHWLDHKAEFDRVPKLSTKANIARYEIVNRYGGAYFDTDFEPLRNVEDLLQDCTMAVCPERPGLLENAFFAATPGHPVLRYVLDRLSDSIESNFGRPSPEMCGPVFFTRAVERGTAITGADVTWLPRHCFYPYNLDQTEMEEAYDFPGTYAIHRWAKSWVEPNVPAPAPAAPTLKQRIKAPVRRVFNRYREELVGGLIPEKLGIRQTLFVGDGRVLCSVDGRFPLLVSASDLNLLPNLFLNGSSDRKYFRFVRAILRPSDHVLDIGANVGLTVLAAGWCLGPYGRIHAFEPNPACLALLRDNVYMNRNLGLRPEVVVHPVAVGASNSSASFSSSTKHLGRGSLSSTIAGSMKEDVGSLTECTVPVRTLQSELPGEHHLRLVKIDVEGHEHEVLESLGPYLEEGRVDFVDMEINSALSGRSWPVLESKLIELDRRYQMHPHQLRTDGTLERMSIGALIEGPQRDHVVFAAN